MHEETDDALIRKVRDGNDDAFREIVDRYKDGLVNYVSHLVRSRDRAEEIAQDAFVRLYQNASRYRERERLAPYLYRIATNIVITQARREKRWNLLLPRLHASTRDSEPSPETTLMRDEIQRQVTAALESLPVKFRAPLVLFEIEGWSYEEIGQTLSLRCGTVKSRIFRARELMRRSLASWWTGGKKHERHSSAGLHAQSAAPERVARLHF
jgi:RNA polymerase sigma-70 factor, ECF subfamily